MVASLVLERLDLGFLRKTSAPVLAFGSGLMSGVSGTSGPLKGLALRNLGFDRFHLVGAASLVSLAGDITKLAVFSEARLLGRESLLVLAMAAPLMPLTTLIGRSWNRHVSESIYAGLFWAVMVGYTLRVFIH